MLQLMLMTFIVAKETIEIACLVDLTQNRRVQRPSTLSSLKNRREQKKKVKCMNATTKTVRAKVYRCNNKTEKFFFSTMQTMATKVVI